MQFFWLFQASYPTRPYPDQNRDHQQNPKSDLQLPDDRINWNMRLKNFSIFFNVADGMILCGRNVAFHVWKVKNLIESETMVKNKGNLSFSLNYPEKRQKMVHPAGFDTSEAK